MPRGEMKIHPLLRCARGQAKKKARISAGLGLYGAGTRSRTRDLLITSQLLYQLSYTGKEGRHYSHAPGGVNL